MHIGNQFSFLLVTILVITTSCQKQEKHVINIGFIAPLSVRATDLGLSSGNAMNMAVDNYNNNKNKDEPRVNIFIEDDQWSGDLAIPAYERLKKKHDIDLLFVSNTDGVKALANRLLEDNMIVVNPLNNGAALSNINRNVIRIAKSTEEAHNLIAKRIMKLRLKKPVIFQYPNEFMSLSAGIITKSLKKVGVECLVVTPPQDEVDYTSFILDARVMNCDSYIFLGYKEYGHAMRQVRELGITDPFFGSTVLMDPLYYKNSNGEIVGTECCFFTPRDGNEKMAMSFLSEYENKFGNSPVSVWPPMQAYDAMNIVLEELRTFKKEEVSHETFDDLLREKLVNVKFHKGICGNISIKENGASTGIRFSMYRYNSEGQMEPISE